VNCRDPVIKMVVRQGKSGGPAAAVFDVIRHDGPRDPDYTELGRSHGRIIHGFIWVTTAEGVAFPHASQVDRLRRDGYDRTAL
jgi:hypothetical protein